MKSFAVFYMAQHSHYERNLALIWLCGIGIFLVAIGLASNAIYLEGSVQYYSIPKSTVTKKYTILELANRVSE